MIGTIGFTALIHGIPIFICTIIINTTPNMTSLLVYLILGDKVSKLEIYLMTRCFSGIVGLALAKVWYLEEHVGTPKSTLASTTSSYILGIGIILFTAWCFSGNIVMTRKMKELHTSLLMFQYGWFASNIIGTCLIIGHSENYQNELYEAHNCPSTFRLFCYNSTQWFLMIAVGITNAI